jgi:MFS family permease
VHKSPLAAAAVVVAGLTSAAFRMVGPVYGQAVGLRLDQIGLFLAAFVLGGALAQYPVGWLADKYDRRLILIWISLAAMASCATTVLASTGTTTTIFMAAIFFGFTTFPVFSVAAAHAHDYADSNERIELSAALIFLFALGAILSPVVASTLISHFGPPALFVFLALGHLVLVVFGLSRMRVRGTVENRTPYVYAPRTSFQIGRLLRRQRDKGQSPKDTK